MMLGDADRESLRASWARFEATGDLGVALFYARLFREVPEARGLFATDIIAQGRRLHLALAFIVEALDNPEQLVAAARELGRRHVGYGVEVAHYDAVGEALLGALGDCLGPDFDDATRNAWAQAYAMLAAEAVAAHLEVTSPAAKIA